MAMIRTLAICLLLLLTACNNNGISTDSNGNTIFTHPPIGWVMKLPQDWQVLTATERMKLAYKAENFYEENTITANAEQKEIILGVRKQKDDINAVYAFTRQYKKGEDQPDLAALLQQQYSGYTTGNYSATKELTQDTISGIIFDKAELQVQYNGQPYFSYTTYSTMLGTLNFGISITANNKTDYQLLLNNFKQSVSSIQQNN